MTTPAHSGEVTGLNTEPATLMTKTAAFPSLTTGRVPNSAHNPGSAEVPDFAREVDGALDMMDAKEPHSQIKLQDLPPTAEHVPVSYTHLTLPTSDLV